MPSKPKVLISSGRIHLTGSGPYSRTSYNACSMGYADSVLAAGGMPILLPLAHFLDLESLLDDIADGVILTGGGDVSPLAYGQEPRPFNKRVDPTRDELELRLAQIAMARGIPLLGICRGIQVLNVACGGTLIQDITAEIPHALQHDADSVDTLLAHTIDIARGSKFESVMGNSTVLVNSYHHQAIADLGPGLTAVATARDGIIEAVEAADSRPVLGVQFHPEEQSHSAALIPQVFSWVVRESVKYRSK